MYYYMDDKRCVQMILANVTKYLNVYKLIL